MASPASVAGWRLLYWWRGSAVASPASVVCVYSILMSPTMSAMAWMSVMSSSMGSNAVLSEMSVMCCWSCAGLILLMSGPCAVSRTYGLFHWKKMLLSGTFLHAMMSPEM